MITTLPRSIWTNPIHFIACAFGIGTLPIMPGTWATLASIPLCLALNHLPIWGYFSVTVLLILLGVWVCDKTNRDFGSDDHPACAWDELASFPLVMLAVPMTWYYLAAGVILFRCFDILKPGPIGWIDRHIHGGIGVMLDDVAAALVSLGILQLIVHWVG